VTFAEWPYLWGILAAPLAFAVGWLAISGARARLARFAARARLRSGRHWADTFLAAAALGLLACALAGPEERERADELRRRPLDVVVALDTSRSMWAGDVAPSRIERARREIKALLDRMDGAGSALRAGLVEFAGTARAACPLTADAAAFRALLDEADGGRLEQGGTRLSTGLRAALECLEGDEPAERAVILVTDGEDRGAALLFEEAVAEAAARDILVCAVVVGTPEGARIPLPGGGFVADASGGEVLSAATYVLPAAAAAKTGGVCLATAEYDFTMDTLFERIAGRVAARERPYPGERDRSLYQWFVLGALILLLIALFVPHWPVAARAARRARFAVIPAALSAILLAALSAVLLLASCGSGGGLAGAREGNRLLRAGDARAAAGAFERCLRERPGDAAVRVNLGLAFYRTGAYERALERLARVEMDGDAAAANAARFGRALCLYRLAERDAGSGGAAGLEAALIRARTAASLFQASADGSFHAGESAGNKNLALALAGRIEKELEAARIAAARERGSAGAGEGDEQAGEGEGETAEEGAPAAGEGALVAGEGALVERAAALGEDPRSLSPEAIDRIFQRLAELKEARRAREAQQAERKLEREMDW